MSEVFLEIPEIFLQNFEMIFEIFRDNSQNFPKYFSECYETILLNNYRIFRNFLIFFKIILKILVIFLITSRNISGNFQKFSEIIFEIFRNYIVLKIFRNTRKCSKYFSKYFKIFWNDFRKFPINDQNFPKHFSKFYEMNLKILRNNPRNFSNFFKIILKNFVNIYWNYQKYFRKFSEIFQNNFRDFSKWQF